jgi:CheY-like chemotaxis protein
MPLRVGWVDDTALIRQLAVRLIERSGHTCRSFPRHVDLLEADREEPFDVVVLQPEDAVSPRSTQQRLLARCPRRAIALASGHSVERLRDTLGVDPATFDRFVPKPFDPRTLMAWLDQLEAEDRAGEPCPVMADGVHGIAVRGAWNVLHLPAAN